MTDFFILAVPSSAVACSVLASEKTELHLYLEKRQIGVSDFRNGVLLLPVLDNNSGNYYEACLNSS